MFCDSRKIIFLAILIIISQNTFAITDTNWQSPWNFFDTNFKAQYQLIGENLLHWHDARYYTKTQSDTNWNKYTLKNADINFRQLQNYPSACPAGKVIQAIGDNNYTCIQTPAAFIDTNWQTDYATFDANLKSILKSINQTQKYAFFDDFDGSTTGQFWTVDATGAGAGSFQVDSVAGENTYGVVQINKGTVGSGRAALIRGTGSILLGQGEVTIMFIAKLSALAGTTQGFNVELGLHDTTSIDAVDGVYFDYAPKSYGDQLIRCDTASNSVNSSSSSGINMNTSWHTYKIIINAAGTEAKFYIDNTLVCTNTTNIPTGAGRATGPRMQITNDGGATAEYFLVDYWSEIISFTNPR